MLHSTVGMVVGDAEGLDVGAADGEAVGETATVASVGAASIFEKIAKFSL